MKKAGRINANVSKNDISLILLINSATGSGKAL